jgi:hypothetical protein
MDRTHNHLQLLFQFDNEYKKQKADAKEKIKEAISKYQQAKQKYNDAHSVRKSSETRLARVSLRAERSELKGTRNA